MPDTYFKTGGRGRPRLSEDRKLCRLNIFLRRDQAEILKAMAADASSISEVIRHLIDECITARG